MLLFQATNPDVNLTLIAPELIVGIAGVVVMLVDAFRVATSAGAVALADFTGRRRVAAVWLWTANRLNAPHSME
jgi:hypothetical protein